MQENPLPLGEAWTIEAWFAHSLPETPLWNTLTCGKDADQQIIVQQGKKLGTFIDRGGDFHDSGYDLSQLAPGWHHLAAVGQGTGEAATTTFYIDGRRVGQVQAKSTTDIYAIGNHQSGQQPFGKLAEIRVWETALPEDEIEINSKVVLSGNEPGLLAYYPLREASGTVARDHTGHGHNGTMQAARWSGCTAPIGNPGHKVMAFDGANDAIEVPALGTEMRTCTIEAWVKADRLEGWHALWNDSGWLPGDVHVQFIDGILEFGINGNSPAGQRFGYAFLPDTWYHLTVAYDASAKTVTLYVNGKKQEERAYETTRSLTFDGPSRIGSWETQRYFSGVMSELRIWNRTRTSEEIQAASHKRLTGREAGLIGYWPLHSIEMTEDRHRALDFTGNHTGTIHGAILVDDNALPIVGEAVVSTEYATLGLDPATGEKSAMLRRFLASPAVAGVQLLSGKRIEFLDRLWIGNAQFAPTLLGYIEGAPPVPSENLTAEDDYNGVTSVELTMSEDVAYTWNREQEAGLG